MKIKKQYQPKNDIVENENSYLVENGNQVENDNLVENVYLSGTWLSW